MTIAERPRKTTPGPLASKLSPGGVFGFYTWRRR